MYWNRVHIHLHERKKKKKAFGMNLYFNYFKRQHVLVQAEGFDEEEKSF